MIKVVSLVENTTTCGCRTAHGLSLYIETPHHRILFDVGGDDTFLYNAEELGVDLSRVDTVIISHGHKDHGGAIDLFLRCNTEAKVYVQRRAFNPHWSHRPTGVGDIGLDSSFVTNERLVLLDGDFVLDEELSLFQVKENGVCPLGANATLYEGESPDRFEHEQNLMIHTPEPILVMGCGHNGVVNIMHRARVFSPKVCIGGFHLTNPSEHRDEPRELIDEIIEQLKPYHEVAFYTCHCTGKTVYEYMRSRMENMHYLSCGESLEVGV